MALSKNFLRYSSLGTALIAFAPLCAAQAFAPIPALSFTKALHGANPLPQILTVANSSVTAASLAFVASWSTSSGGNWLSVDGLGCGGSSGSACGGTPRVVKAMVIPDIALAAGTYMGQITLNSGAAALTIPVTLTVQSPASAFFDTLPGGLTFTVKTGGANPSSQTVRVRNAGTGALSWTSAISTADGGSWLTTSTSTAASPATFSVAVTPSALPGGGFVPGNFVGMVTLRSATGSVTIPVSVTVAGNVLNQLNPLEFTKSFAGQDPLPQIVVASATTSASIGFTASWFTSTGGSWLSVSGLGCGGGSGSACGATPRVITIAISTAADLPAGTYTGEVVLNASTTTLVIPVTLTVSSQADTFFDSLPGQLSFAMKTHGNAISPRTLHLRNAGAGTLAWSTTISTADGGKWLSVSSPSGNAPYDLTVQVTPANLPGGGLVAGSFTGELLFTAGDDAETVPVSVSIGDNVLSQLDEIAFARPFGGANPLPQILQAASTAAGTSYTASWYTAGGGDWLGVRGVGCGGGSGSACGSTPGVIRAIAAAPAALSSGAYSGEIVLSTVTMAMTVPVTFTVGPAADGTLFDNLPGQLAFSMKTAGATPPSRSLEVRNVGTGALNWALSTKTSDGGNWLNVSSASGMAPGSVAVSISPLLLPGGGLVAGTFTGSLVFSSGGTVATVPVAVVVSDDAFTQIGELKFTKPVNGSDPLPQNLTVTTLGSAISFTAAWAAATGGDWLTVTGLGCGGSSESACGTTPRTALVRVTTSASMPAGTYTGEIVFYSNTSSMTVPVSLTVTTSAPSVEAAVPVFVGNSGFSSNTYLALYGKNLATTTRAWDTAFSGSTAPTTLDGVSVTVNGIPAFVEYVSPGQINIDTPDDTATGPVIIQVKNGGGVSATFTATRARLSPTLLATPDFSRSGKNYVVAQSSDFSRFIGPANLLPGVAFSGAKPGDTVIVYAIGCGPTSPANPAGHLAGANSPLALPFQVKIGGVQAQVPFAGILAGTVGLYQLNIVVPPGVGSGDQPIEFTVDGVPNAQGLYFTVAP